MKKLAIALLATAAFGMPAMAASNMTQQPQAPQAQQSQGQQSQVQYPNNNNKNQQAQYPNNQQGQPNNANQAAQNESNSNNQTFSPQKLSRNEIRQVQQALDKNGQQVGRVDGRWGRKTSDALKQFQQSKGIQTNGQLDQQTLSDLGLNGAQFAQQNQNNASQTQ